MVEVLDGTACDQVKILGDLWEIAAAAKAGVDEGEREQVKRLFAERRRPRPFQLEVDFGVC
jgi:hypothetical protein